METEKIVKTLRIEMAAVLLWAILLIALFETEVLPSGWAVGQAAAEYYMSMTGVMMLLILVPVALKLFSFRFVRRVFSGTDVVMLPRRYRFWSEIRLAMLAVTGWINLTFYYLTLDTSCAFCALVALLALCFCWPSAEKLEHETGWASALKKVEDDEKEKNT